MLSLHFPLSISHLPLHFPYPHEAKWLSKSCSCSCSQLKIVEAYLSFQPAVPYQTHLQFLASLLLLSLDQSLFPAPSLKRINPINTSRLSLSPSLMPPLSLSRFARSNTSWSSPPSSPLVQPSSLLIPSSHPRTEHAHSSSLHHIKLKSPTHSHNQWPQPVGHPAQTILTLCSLLTELPPFLSL